MPLVDPKPDSGRNYFMSVQIYGAFNKKTVNNQGVASA